MLVLAFTIPSVSSVWVHSNCEYSSGALATTFPNVLEWHYNVTITGMVTEFWYLLKTEYYTSLDDWFLWIDGENCSNPDVFVNEPCFDGDGTLFQTLKWINLAISVTGGKPFFELECISPVPEYWYVNTIHNSGDLDRDGDTLKWYDGVLDGDLDGTASTLHDPMYRFFYMSGTQTEVLSCPADGLGGVGFSPSGNIQFGYQYVSCHYASTLRATITDVYLQVDHTMYDHNIPSIYKMKINEDTTEYPGSYWYTVSNETYVLAFENVTSTVNGTVSFIFSAEDYLEYESGRRWALSYVNFDLNNDNHQYITAFKSATSGIWTKWDTYYRDVLAKQILPDHAWEDRDLIIQVCYGDSTDYDIDTSYYNYLEAYPHTVKPKCEQVTIFYMVNSTTLGYPMLLYIDNGGTVVDGYPIQLTSQSKTYIYTPTTTGSYTVNLNVNGVNISNDTFTASGTCDNYIYTHPNPSQPYGGYNIYYKYNYTEWEGRVKITRLPDKDFVKAWLVARQSETVIPDMLRNTGSYEVSLNLWYRNSTDSLVDSILHGVGMDRINTIYIREGDNPIRLDDLVQFYGTHNHLNNKVVVRVGNRDIENVGYTDQYVVNWRADIPGTYAVRLMLITKDTEIQLARTTEDLVVTTVGADGGGYSIPDLVMIAFPDIATRTIIGLAIVMSITFMPFLAVLKLRKRDVKINIPSIMYVACFVTGVIVAWVLGFLAWQITFFLCFIVISIMAGGWLYGKKTESVGEG